MIPRVREACRSVVLAALGLVVTLPAAADDRGVAAGRRLYLEAQFPAAERTFEEVTRDVSATRSELVEAYSHLAILKLARADRDGAYGAALAAVSLRWGAVPPEGVPPEAFELFEEARSRVPRSGLTAALDLTGSPIAGAPLSALARVTGDLARLAAAVEIGCGDGRERARRQLEHGADGRSHVRLSVPLAGADEDIRCDMIVLSQVGVVLARAIATAHATGRRMPGERGDRPASGKLPLVLIGVGAAVVVATVTIVLVAASGDAGAELGPPEFRWIDE